MFLKVLLLFTTFSFSQDNNEEKPQTPFEYTKKIYNELEDIKKIKPEDYFAQIDEYRVGLEKYIDHKKRVCEGEFSFIILSDPTLANKKDQSKKGNKLSKEEQALCFRELKALQITFINNMFVARKKYLDYLHKRRINELQSTRDIAIKELNKQFNKRIVKKRKR